MSKAARLTGAVLALCIVAFAATFAYGRANRPDTEVEAVAAPLLETLPKPSAPPAIPVLAHADALPPIKVKKPKRKPPSTTGTATGSTPTAGASSPSTETTDPDYTNPGTNTNTYTPPSTNTTNTSKNSGSTQKKDSGSGGIQKTGSGGSVAGGGTPED